MNKQAFMILHAKHIHKRKTVPSQDVKRTVVFSLSLTLILGHFRLFSTILHALRTHTAE